MYINAKTLLVLAGTFSLALAFLHVEIIYVGAPAYRFFGAGEQMAVWSEAGSLLPTMLTLAVALVLAVFAAYAFSGAGLIRDLPFLRIGLWAIGGVLTLRGLAVICQTAQLMWGQPGPAREMFFSLVSLALGFVYLAGAHGASASRASGLP